MNKREFHDLVMHMEWADAHMWRSIRDLPGAHEDARLRYLLHHMHLTQLVYLQAWRGDPFQVTELSSYPNLPSLATWAARYYPVARAFADDVDESRLDRAIEFPWSKMIKERFGEVAPTTFAESAWQVVSHTTYHRGQVATRVREIGGEPPLVDFLVWVWQGRPSPEW